LDCGVFAGDCAVEGVVVFLVFLCFFTAVVGAVLPVLAEEFWAGGVWAGALPAGACEANIAAAVISEVRIKRFILSLSPIGVLSLITHESIMRSTPRMRDHPRTGASSASFGYSRPAFLNE
jgi:hypothetical protein